MQHAAQYYDETAQAYDDLHGVDANPEHTRALELGWPLFGPVASVLDVGSGTGRSLVWLRDRSPNLKLLGIEPSQGMIDIARTKLPTATIRQGTGEALPSETGSIDLVIATGVMHHADNPSRVIDEMLRVARKGILISDHNNYAFGGGMARRVRMVLKLCSLLNTVNYVRQGLNKRGYSDDDGWWYPYSLFDNYSQIATVADRVYVIPTRKPVGDGNLLFTQGHFAIAALKA